MKSVDELAQNWTPTAIERLPMAKPPSELPLFVLGMPRSGTTLVEQILACHPCVAGAGELPDLGNLVHSLSKGAGGPIAVLTSPAPLTRRTLDLESWRYLNRLRQAGARADRVVDKTPQNFFHLGLIWALLPRPDDAPPRVIHCLRDPMDTCLSAYFHLGGVNSSWSRDLRHIGAFYLAYRRVMAHWLAVLDIKPMDVQYESHVQEQDLFGRRLLEYAGLP